MITMTRQHTIKCWHCKSTHGTVNEVRECSQANSMFAQQSATRVDDPFDAPQVQAPQVQAPVRTAPGTRGPVAEPGMYRKGDDIFKVVRSQSGHLYAKMQAPEGGFEYAPGAMRELSADDRMTMVEAAAYGKRTGVCIVCGRTLTHPDSVAAGIGPVCGGRI